MTRPKLLSRMLVTGCMALSVLFACGGPGAAGREFTRRGVERDFISSPAYGSARGRKFEDIIPVGARIVAVHTTHTDHVAAIWLSYERNGDVRQTPRRGASAGREETFKLDPDEKIVAIDACGRGTIDGLVVVTNKRTRTFGNTGELAAATEAPWYKSMTERDRRRHVAIGITGRADSELRQLSLRIQVRHQG